jgi:hypothetical protein
VATCQMWTRVSYDKNAYTITFAPELESAGQSGAG